MKNPPDLDAQIFGRIVREYREKAELTQEDLIGKAVKEKGHLSKIENGHMKPQQQTVLALVRELKIDWARVPRRLRPRGKQSEDLLQEDDLYHLIVETRLVERTALNERLKKALTQPNALVILSGPSGTGKTELAKSFCVRNGYPYEFVGSSGRADNDEAYFIILDDWLRPKPDEDDVSIDTQIMEIKSIHRKSGGKPIILTARPSAGAYPKLRPSLSGSFSITEIKMEGLTEEEFKSCLENWCEETSESFDASFCDSFFQQCRGLPLALQLYFSLKSSSIGGYHARDFSKLNLSVDGLLHRLRKAVSENSPEIMAILEVLANTPNFAMNPTAVAHVLDKAPSQVAPLMMHLILNGLANLVLPLDPAVRLHDAIKEVFCLPLEEQDRVIEMKQRHCGYWSLNHDDDSFLTMVDSLVVSSEVLFLGLRSSAPGSSDTTGGLVMMRKLLIILGAVSDHSIESVFSDDLERWMCTYLQENKDCISCYELIPLALLALRLKNKTDCLGEAFAAFWENPSVEDPTIIAPAVVASVHHLGDALQDRLEAALWKLPASRTSDKSMVAAALCSAMTRVSKGAFAQAFVTGHNCGPLDPREAIAGMLCVIARGGSEIQKSLFVQTYGNRLSDLNPVLLAYLRSHCGVGIDLPSGEFVEANLNRVLFLSHLYGEPELEAYTIALSEYAEEIQYDPPIHQIPISHLHKF